MSLVVRWVTKGIIICKPVSKGLGLNTCTDRRALMFGIFIDLLEAILEHRLKSVSHRCFIMWKCGLWAIYSFFNLIKFQKGYTLFYKNNSIRTKALLSAEI